MEAFSLIFVERCNEKLLSAFRYTFRWPIFTVIQLQEAFMVNGENERNWVVLSTEWVVTWNSAITPCEHVLWIARKFFSFALKVIAIAGGRWGMYVGFVSVVLRSSNLEHRAVVGSFLNRFLMKNEKTKRILLMHEISWVHLIPSIQSLYRSLVYTKEKNAWLESFGPICGPIWHENRAFREIAFLFEV